MSSIQSISVVIHQINLRNIGPFEPKNNAPISANPHRPETFQFSLQGVQLQTGQIHLFRGLSHIETGKNARDLGSQRRRHSLTLILHVESIQALMAKTPNHDRPSGASGSECKLTSVTCQIVFRELTRAHRTVEYSPCPGKRETADYSLT